MSYVLGRRGEADDIASWKQNQKQTRSPTAVLSISEYGGQGYCRRKYGRADEREQLLRSSAAPREGQPNPTSANARKPSGVVASVYPSCIQLRWWMQVPNMVCWWLCEMQIGWATVAECSNLGYTIPIRNARFYARRRSWLCGLRFAVPKGSCKRWPLVTPVQMSR